MKIGIIALILGVFLLAACAYQSGTQTPLAASKIAQSDVPDNVGAAAPAGDNAVIISNFAFNPKELTIHAGEKVVWTNEDSVSHAIVGDNYDLLSSGTLSKGDTYSMTFDKTGTYAYHCSVHPSMKAAIIVK